MRLPLTFVSTTKWFMSQCRIAGRRSLPSAFERDLHAARRHAHRSRRSAAMCLSVMPFSDGDRRRRIAERSVRWPW